MNSPGVRRGQFAALTAFVAFDVLMCIGTPYPRDQWLQQSPLVLAVFALAWSAWRMPLSHRSFALTLLFLGLHAIGARYVYSYVPYDAWTSRLFGFEVNALCGFRRNHYDRLAHFCFGLLLARPLRELVVRAIGSVGWFSYVATFALITALGALYELAEWGVAMTFAPDWADRYLGQQGDPWDAHWDMALAAFGAVLALVVIGVTRRLRDE